jgi:hypothetical protein
LWSTNLLERSLGEVRRRTKVMGRFCGETSCLSLVWAVLDLFFSHASNGATFTDVDRQHLLAKVGPPYIASPAARLLPRAPDPKPSIQRADLLPGTRANPRSTTVNCEIGLMFVDREPADGTPQRSDPISRARLGSDWTADRCRARHSMPANLASKRLSPPVVPTPAAPPGKSSPSTPTLAEPRNLRAGSGPDGVRVVEAHLGDHLLGRLD